MLTQLVNFVGSTLQTSQVTAVNPTVQDSQFVNPFINNGAQVKTGFYGQNRPVQGGYFAGYYNGKPNIVGRQLFIEV